jgi:hypothetical protein
MSPGQPQYWGNASYAMLVDVATKVWSVDKGGHLAQSIIERRRCLWLLMLFEMGADIRAKGESGNIALL